jgi:hypothetical protein
MMGAFFTSFKGMVFVTILLLLALLLLPGEEPKTVSNISTHTANPTPPIVQGLYLGMSIAAAETVINNGLAKFLFESDEFMYSPFAHDSKAYKDAEILRKNIRFIKNSDGSFDFGGSFSFGYKSNNLRSSYTNVYKIIDKNTKLSSRKQSFGAGITIKADSNKKVYSLLFKPNFIKSSFGIKDISNEDFIKSFVRKHNLDSLKKHINGAFTGDMSVTYTHVGNSGFKVTIDDDLEIQIMYQESSP